MKRSRFSLGPTVSPSLLFISVALNPHRVIGNATAAERLHKAAFALPFHLRPLTTMKVLRSNGSATAPRKSYSYSFFPSLNLWAPTAKALVVFLCVARPYHQGGTEALPFRGRSHTQTAATEADANESSNDAAAASVAQGGSPISITVQWWNQQADLTGHGGRPQNRRNAVVEQFLGGGGKGGDDDNADYDGKASLAMLHDVRSQARNLTDFLVATRRDLHRHPELMYQEERTSHVVQRHLAEMGIAFTTGWARNAHPHVHPGPGGYGVVADIGTGSEPCVLLRADMDALPIDERTEGVDDFRSLSAHRMHACGHDAHTTMLLGAAAILKQMEDSIPGTVRLVFQPAEEGGAGAKRMREEGVLEQWPIPAHAFGMHVWPTLPSGVIASRPGPLLAACERFEILVSGVGGHAAMPHLTVDPIVAASAIVMNLQTIVSRTVSPLESGVCSITKFEAGDAYNVIPAAAVLRGTVRALSTEALLLLRDRVQRIVDSTAAAHGCNVTIQYSPDYYPPTVNDPDLYDTFSQQVAGLVSVEGVARDTEPTMGAEDFGFFAESVPSTFFFLGSGSGINPPTNYGLHHPHFAVDESVLSRGVELHVNLALRALRKLSRESLHQRPHLANDSDPSPKSATASAVRAS